MCNYRMAHNHLIVLCLMLWVWNWPQHGYAQQSSTTVPLPGKGDSCNVVNLHCGASPSAPNKGTPNRLPGAPGKVGPVGPVGPQGMKGDKGRRGGKGDKGLDANVAETLLKVADMLDVSNCTQLRNQGITKSGNYQLCTPDGLSTRFEFCDFGIYDGVATCDELRRRIKVENKGGRYFLRNGPSSEAREVSCSGEPRFTCNELSLDGVRMSGTRKMIAVNSEETFNVHCRETGDKVITEIWHAQMGEIQNPSDRRCQPHGCYSWTPQYEISRDHILGVIAKSNQCRQYIKARCVQTSLLSGPTAWWVSRDGEKMRYWGGATSRRDGYCACGETGSCINSLKCNCDTNSATEGTDEGYLTDKTKLPVRELRFGDLDSSNEFVWHTLGKLECWGQT